MCFGGEELKIRSQVADFWTALAQGEPAILLLKTERERKRKVNNNKNTGEPRKDPKQSHATSRLEWKKLPWGQQQLHEIQYKVSSCAAKAKQITSSNCNANRSNGHLRTITSNINSTTYCIINVSTLNNFNYVLILSVGPCCLT